MVLWRVEHDQKINCLTSLVNITFTMFLYMCQHQHRYLYHLPLATVLAQICMLIYCCM